VPEITNLSKNIRVITDAEAEATEATTNNNNLKAAKDSLNKIINNKEINRYREELSEFITIDPVHAYMHGYKKQDQDQEQGD
jgi:hypothetical protein